MKITKQKIGHLIQILIAAYLIVSGCAELDKSAVQATVIQKNINRNRAVASYTKDKKSYTQNIQPVFKPTIETLSFTNTFLLKNP